MHSTEPVDLTLYVVKRKRKEKQQVCKLLLNASVKVYDVICLEAYSYVCVAYGKKISILENIFLAIANNIFAEKNMFFSGKKK